MSFGPRAVAAMAASLALDPAALEVGAERSLVHEGERGDRGFPLCEHPGCRAEAIGPFAYLCAAHWLDAEPAEPHVQLNLLAAA